MINPIKILNLNIRTFQRTKNVKDFMTPIKCAETEIAKEINKLNSDTEKILEFEKIKGNQNAFIIIDKKRSVADVYKEGKPTDSFDIGIGEKFGDDLNSAKYINGKFVKEGRTTPSGQFFTYPPYDFNITNKEDFEAGKVINCLLLDGVQHPAGFNYRTTLALHQVSKSHPERLPEFNIKDRRRGITTGCVNFLPEEFYRLAEEITPNRTPVYILPEEKGNKLELVLLPDGLWFKTNYADTKKENEFLSAMAKFFKLR